MAKTKRGNRRDPWSGLDVGVIFGAFGWRVIELDGHDYDQITEAFRQARVPDADGRPTVLVAQTVKGKGLSLAEGTYTWHSVVPTTEQVDQARSELVPDLADSTIGASEQPEFSPAGSALRIEGGRV